MLWLKNVTKTYETKDHKIEAVKAVNLHVEPGKIMGIIGYSGAGKSTLIRCINLLEKPTSGEVIIDGRDLTKLSPKELRKTREKVGMIFQHFNLMKSRNVFENVAYPLKGKDLSKQQMKEKVESLLEIVGLSDKITAYPSQLSGGQKQRVAIARALANDPKLLLCDEATSALDPQTTQSILKLLKDINEKLGLTIVIITHQMEVVKEICHRAAIMEKGRIVEESNVIDIFSKPKAQVTKDFVSTVFHYDRAYEFLNKDSFIEELTEEEIVARISYIGQKAGQAFISKISRKFKVDASIIFGNIELIQETPIGNLVVKFKGSRDGIIESINYLKQNDIYVEVLKNATTSLYLYAECNRTLS
ncbi:methionine ABC transporter ATP-binding protein [Clostridium sp. YIM B02515]|uniref:Methionine ABC transporter ATP-binding protein n=1 Tax=Clostridium rhizosphaerae TaxID=2803861 RepID=A0ABS1TD84_9CLOT|nr:methionine ABC transporter ATP-binding protein [Clostridium rhizosphaerae]MBL4937320.1 methionine ABC transporter ATP-binding protein [Clostridium rhizosphaerae]